MDIPMDPVSLRRSRIGLCIGLMLCFSALWKGDNGYLDLREYMEITEQLWLHGTMRLPETVLNQPRYHRYSPGLPVLAGPLLWAGVGIEKLSHGRISHRTIAALTVPLLGILGCLLLFEILCLLNMPASSSMWAVLLVALASPLLEYIRQFFTEVAVFFCLALAIWAYLKSSAIHATNIDIAGKLSFKKYAWRILAGAGLAGVTACHYPELPLSVTLWFVWSVQDFRAYKVRRNSGWQLLLAHSCIPILAGIAILVINTIQNGHPFRTGYYLYYEGRGVSTFSLSTLPRNLYCLGAWLLRVPWWIPAMIGLWRLRKISPVVGFACLIALVAQTGFWLFFTDLFKHWTRYFTPLVALGGLGLGIFGAWLVEKKPQYGLKVGLLLGLLWNAGYLLSDTVYLPFQHSLVWKPFFGVWYLPFGEGLFGWPIGVWQIGLFLLMAGGGAGCFFWMFRKPASSKQNIISQNSDSEV